MSTNHDPWRLLFFLMLLAFTGTAGCGELSNEVSVSGHVTYRGKPLPGGSITFFPASGRPVMSVISDDGTYSAEMPPGDYVVALGVSTDLPPGFKEGDPIPPPKVDLPPHYTSRVRSRLSASVTEDTDEPINFELK